MDELEQFLGEKDTGIQLNDKYKIDTIDELNVAVKEIVIGKDGKQVFENDGSPRYKVTGYFPNIEKAWNWIITKEINVTVKNGPQAVIKKIEELKSYIKERC